MTSKIWFKRWAACIGLSLLSAAHGAGTAWCQAPVTAMMGRPVIQGGELKARIEMFIEPGWQVYGPNAEAKLGPVSIGLTEAPNHEISSLKWPEATSVAAPDGAKSGGYLRGFQVEISVRPRAAQEGPSRSFEAQREIEPISPAEPREDEPASSAEIVPLRASVAMTWTGCDSARLREGGSSLKSSCIPGEALFVLKELPAAQAPGVQISPARAVGELTRQTPSAEDTGAKSVPSQTLSFSASGGAKSNPKRTEGTPRPELPKPAQN
jgi:hypothetical protein